jgi:hypothetical protein
VFGVAAYGNWFSWFTSGSAFRTGTNKNNRERQMASEGDRLQKIIGERLRDMFQQTVEEPLPPLILQVIRRLHEREEAESEASAAKAPVKPIKWDLVLRAGRSEPPRQ